MSMFQLSDGSALDRYESTSILNPEMYLEFWISWSENKIRAGRGLYPSRE